MRPLIFTISIVILSLNLFSQDYSKLDIELKSKLSNNTKRSSINYNVFVEGNIDIIKGIISENGGDINTVTSSLLTARIPYKTLETLSLSKGVKHIQLARSMQPSTNEVIKNIEAIKVHQGEKPLNKPYKGKGVIVGIIDSGIDIEHEDFRVPDDPSKSRILAIWDQKASEFKKSQSVPYGREYTKEEIEASINSNTKIPFKDDLGHGTHVAGIAAGNLGVAPEADIVVVKISFLESTPSVDAANYIYSIADKLNRPCVINASYGFQRSLHNGSDPMEIMLSELVNEKHGRAFVNAAGNSGKHLIHIKAETKTDEQWTWVIPYTVSSHRIDLHGAVKNEDLNKISIAFGLDSITTENANTFPSMFIKKTNYITLKEIADIDDEKVFEIPYRDNSIAATIHVTISKRNEEYSEVSIKLDEEIKTKQTNKGVSWIRLYMKGSGKMHLWRLFGKFIHNPKEFDLATYDNYIYPDNSYAIGTPGSSKSTITVGGYVNRPEEGYQKGEFMPFSSQGPTIDGRIKPEISAPGMFVISAAANNKENKHVSKSGTSMSCPAVTGAIALLLEKNPTLTNKEIRDILFANTDKDEFTGELTTPDNKWGFGKINIYKTLVNTVDTEEISGYDNKVLRNIYPNPCNDYLQLKMNGDNNCNIEIYNTMGGLVYKQQTNQQQKNIKVNTNNWNSGLYLIKSSNGKAIEQYKFIKK
ncbi:MAG: S8/S53 family peptidase [Hyphomicrobiales bacterium]